MSTARAMKNNAIENVNRKVKARIVMEILYKKGRVGEKITVTQDMFRKAVATIEDARNRVAVTAIHIGGPAWAATKPLADGSIEVTKVSNDRRRDRERIKNAKRRAVQTATDLHDPSLDNLAYA